MKRFRTVALAGLLAFSLAACDRLFDRQVSSAVLALGGSAEITRQGKAMPLRPNEWILPGCKVATAPESRLDLMLLPGVLLQLTGNTEIEITRLRFAREGDETIRPMLAREGSIRLLRGTLFGATGESQMRSRIFIETAAGNLTAYDLRSFKITVEENRTRVFCVRGKISFQPAGDGPPVKLDAGYLAEWPSPHSAPKAAAESGAKIQAEVPEILRVEKHLFRRQKEFGLGYAPWRRRSGDPP